MTIPLTIDLDSLDFKSPISSSSLYAVSQNGVHIINNLSLKDVKKSCMSICDMQEIRVTHISKMDPNIYMGVDSKNKMFVLTNPTVFEILNNQKQAVLLKHDIFSHQDHYNLFTIMPMCIKKEIESYFINSHQIDCRLQGSGWKILIGYITQQTKKYCILLEINFKEDVCKQKIYWKICDYIDIHEYVDTRPELAFSPNMDIASTLSFLSKLMR